MATTNRDVDQLKFKIGARFSGKHVTHQGRSRWWDNESAATEEWRQIKKIGQGGHGAVYLQRSRASQELRAVKSLQPEYLKKTCGLDFKRELQTLIAVRERPDLFVRFLGWYEDKQGGFVYFAMEYLPDGDLGQYLEDKGPLADSIARAVTKQLLEALQFLHARSICHRDLKPQNVLIASKSLPVRVKLADFGVSKPTTASLVSLRQGTIAYIAPELLGMLQGRNTCTSAVDIWALGCILYEMLTLETPFMDRRPDKMSTMISTISGIQYTSSPVPTDMSLLYDYCKGKIGLPIGILQRSNISDGALYLVKNLLAVDPKHRIPAAIALRYEWMDDLQTASANGQVEVVRRLLGDKDNIRYYGTSALQFAAKNGHAKVVKLLLSNGVKANNQTALQSAARYGHLEVIKLLLRDGAEVNIGLHEFGGRTAVLEAVENGHIEVVKLLLSNGAKIRAAYSGLELASEKGYLKVVKLLLENGVKPVGETALQSAAKNGHVELVKLFMEHKTNKKSEEIKPTTLPVPMKKRLPEIAKTRLDYGDKTNGQTSLLSAAKNGRVEVVKLLLENGVDANAWYYGPMTLQAAAENGNLEVVKLLLKNGAEVNTRRGEHYDQTALQAAARNGNLGVVKLLLRNGAKVNTKPSERYGQTALQAAVEGGHAKVVELLLANGADANAWYGGLTTLQGAAWCGEVEVVKLLLMSGAEVNAKPSELHGRTALQIAMEGGHFAVMRLLLEYGADDNTQHHKPTLLQVPKNKHPKAAKLPLENEANTNIKPDKGYGRAVPKTETRHKHPEISKPPLEYRVRSSPTLGHP